MCEPTTLAAIAIGTAVAGAGTSYVAGQEAASAANSAQAQASRAQNTAFNARMEAQRQQTADQTAINTQSAKTFSQNQAVQQAAQTAALSQRQAVLTGLNDQQAATARQSQNVVQNATQAASAPNLAAAQTGMTQAIQTQNAPVVGQIQTTNPLGASNTGVTKDAMDAALAGATSRAKTYGDTQAVLTGYQAPITLANQSATTLGTNLMPASVADQLVRTSAPALLNPSSTAYQQAGAYGSAANTANSANTQAALGVANTRAQNAIDLASLQQSDTAANIQSQLVAAQQKAAQLAGIGSGLSQIGQAGLTYAGSQGAFAKTPMATPAAQGNAIMSVYG